MWEAHSAVEQFSGTARLFPLPNLVLFPGIEQGLHIFEHRYREMTADALDGDKLIAMALLKPNWEPDYDAKPAIELVCCLGFITASELLPDGRYNLRLQGLTRFRIDSELPADGKLYRRAKGQLLPDQHGKNMIDEQAQRQRLQLLLTERYASHPGATARLTALFDVKNSTSTLCDQLSYSLPLSLDVKQQLLSEAVVPARLRLLLAALEAQQRHGIFPPRFSSN
jgi:uncharacterized protein